MAAAELAAMQAEYETFCIAHADPALVKKYSRYFKEGYDAYGVASEALLPFREELLVRYDSALKPAAVLALGLKLLATGKYELGMLAIALARHILAQLGPAHLAGLAAWLDGGVNNWALCDCLCSEVLTPLLKRGQVRCADLAGWAQAGSRWRRRALPVALIGYAKLTKEVTPLLQLAAPLLHDPERVVHQGLGWFLRECWKLDPAPVEALLLAHVATAPRLVYQYACEKMDAAGKARFRRPKGGAAG
jgi:3-methyladenine DNA glycosylase AlkD